MLLRGGVKGELERRGRRGGKGQGGRIDVLLEDPVLLPLANLTT